MENIKFQVNNVLDNNQYIDIFLSIIEVDNNKIDLKITTKQNQTKVLKDIIKYINDNNIISIESKEIIITRILHDLGLPSNMKGYDYIKEAINIVYNKINISFTKDVYPIIANIYKTTPNNVERNIRHAIDISWNRGNWDLMEEIFGYSIDQEKAKPTNKEYIITIADLLKQKNKALF